MSALPQKVSMIQLLAPSLPESWLVDPPTIINDPAPYLLVV